MDISKLNLNPISEDEVVSIFLRGELKSKRFSQEIVNAIKKLNGDENLIINPDLTKSEENILRKEILEETRKYISREGLFEDFPNDIKWYRVEFSSDFLINQVKYIDYDYWIELSNGSRLPKDAVEKIKNNKRVFNLPYDNFLEASEEFKKNKSFDEIIIVSDGTSYVVLEGHLRLTVYALNKEILPKKVPVIIGISEQMREWGNF
ncbi:MAG: hypothetical protein RBS01_03540 [Candidatus Dojkabacteria bacterium]|jgi:signal peptidase I|nr:hypothetical protein [Candidatus Dojkabacteria bacterium]